MLLTKNDILKYLHITLRENEAVVERYIREVVLFDLKPLMPEAFYNDLLKNTNNYTFLLNGGEYVYLNRTVRFEGLKSVLSYFFGARYFYGSHRVDTPFGLVQKAYNDAEHISATEKRDQQKKMQQEAFLLWEDVRNYLNRNKEKYPLWNEESSQRKGGEVKIRLI